MKKDFQVKLRAECRLCNKKFETFDEKVDHISLCAIDAQHNEMVDGSKTLSFYKLEFKNGNIGPFWYLVDKYTSDELTFETEQRLLRWSQECGVVMAFRLDTVIYTDGSFEAQYDHAENKKMTARRATSGYGVHWQQNMPCSLYPEDEAEPIEHWPASSSNIAELIPVIKVLSKVRNYRAMLPITIVSDSRYVILSVSTYRHKWSMRNATLFHESGKKVANSALMIELLQLIDELREGNPDNVRLVKVKGHRDSRNLLNAGNSAAHQLANEGRKKAMSAWKNVTNVCVRGCILDSDRDDKVGAGFGCVFSGELNTQMSGEFEGYATLKRASAYGVIEAIKKALQENLERLIVYIELVDLNNTINRESIYWEENEYTDKTGRYALDSDLIQEIVELMKKIKVSVQMSPESLYVESEVAAQLATREARRSLREATGNTLFLHQLVDGSGTANYTILNDHGTKPRTQNSMMVDGKWFHKILSWLDIGERDCRKSFHADTLFIDYLLKLAHPVGTRPSDAAFTSCGIAFRYEDPNIAQLPWSMSEEETIAWQSYVIGEWVNERRAINTYFRIVKWSRKQKEAHALQQVRTELQKNPKLKEDSDKIIESVALVPNLWGQGGFVDLEVRTRAQEFADVFQHFVRNRSLGRAVVVTPRELDRIESLLRHVDIHNHILCTLDHDTERHRRYYSRDLRIIELKDESVDRQVN